MKPKVYIETSVVSYLTARGNRDLVVAANQELTREWWDTRRDDFDLVISEIVTQEAAAGDADAAARRIAVIQSIPEIAVTNDVAGLAKAIIHGVRLPSKAQVDALHIAVAAVHGVEYLRSRSAPYQTTIEIMDT